MEYDAYYNGKKGLLKLDDKGISFLSNCKSESIAIEHKDIEYVGKRKKGQTKWVYLFGIWFVILSIFVNGPLNPFSSTSVHIQKKNKQRYIVDLAWSYNRKPVINYIKNFIEQKGEK